jgi:hypothetical protein
VKHNSFAWGRAARRKIIPPPGVCAMTLFDRASDGIARRCRFSSTQQEFAKSISDLFGLHLIEVKGARLAAVCIIRLLRNTKFLR